MKIGKQIKELRLNKGMTQETLAELTELSVRTIQRIEKGEVDPRAYSLQMIAKALDVEYNLLFEEDSKQNRKEQDEKFLSNNWIALLHESCIIPLFLPTILIWNIKNTKPQQCAGILNRLLVFSQ